MRDSDLLNVLDDIMEFVRVQKKFDDVTTQKFNEIIDLVNNLEKRVIDLEDKFKDLESKVYVVLYDNQN